MQLAQFSRWLWTGIWNSTYIAVEIAVPTAGGLLLIGLAVTIWWKWRNNQRDDERRPLRQDGPRQEGADIIHDVSHGSDFERRPAPVEPSRKKDNNLRRVSIWVANVKEMELFDSMYFLMRVPILLSLKITSPKTMFIVS